jgi:hypothetical protein
MSVDLIVIIAHELTLDEILEFPTILNKNEGLKDLFRRDILDFSMEFAKILNSDKVVYCSDTHSTERIESWAIEGQTINGIIDLAIKKFGSPPKSLPEAIENRFFIDQLLKPNFRK